jgi:hypothetical protein
LGLAAFIRNRRQARTWADPVRRLRTLQSFAATEADGGRDLELAARRTHNEELRGHLLRHAADEQKHAAFFRRYAAEARAALARHDGEPAEADQAYDLSRGKRGHEIDAHGFFRAGLFDELGEVAYVAMLHVAEQRAAELFSTHRRLNAHDAPLAESFDEILRDEKYHVAYTARLLERWRAAGRSREVEAGLRAARTSRFLGAWRQLGLRSAAGFAHVLLFVLYWTLLAPFGWIARRARVLPAWCATAATRSSSLSSQA